MTSLINTSFWIIQPLSDNNTNNNFLHTLLLCCNLQSMPEFDRAMEGLKCEVLKEIIQFVIQ